MQILEAIRGLGLGGAETLLVQRLEHAESRSTVLNTAPDVDHYAPRVSSVADLKSTPSRSVAIGVVQTFRMGRRLSPRDVVICHSPAASFGFKLAAWGRPRRFTLVDVVHNTDYRPIYTALSKRLNPAADLAIAVSSDVAAADIAAEYREVKVVLGGVDRPRMRRWITEHPDAFAEMRAEIGVPTDARLVCNVANLTPRKNHALLVRSMADLDAHLVIIGDGPERTKLERLVDELGMRERVHLGGHQDNGWRWMAASDVYAQSSVHEGLPVVLMEAAVLGIPVVATKFGGVDDVTPHAEVHVAPESKFATTLAKALDSAPAARDAWDGRGAAANFFDLGRYVEDFYAAVETAHRLRYAISTWD